MFSFYIMSLVNLMWLTMSTRRGCTSLSMLDMQESAARKAAGDIVADYSERSIKFEFQGPAAVNTD